MPKAFIFDMDGVIVKSEPLWKEEEKNILGNLVGQKTYKKIKDDFLGVSIDDIYIKIGELGISITKEEFLNLYFEKAKRVYSKAQITPGIEELARLLLQANFKLGLVSASPQSWIDLVLPRLSFQDQFSYVTSVQGKNDLRIKPAPDGYLKAMQILDTTPQTTTILEDSNVGVTAAKASKAFTICVTECLPNDYPINQAADVYIDKILDLTQKLKNAQNSKIGKNLKNFDFLLSEVKQGN